MTLDPHLALSPRQLDCLRLAAEGKTSQQIANELGMASRTVDQRLREASYRLGARNRTQAVAKAIASGLL